MKLPPTETQGQIDWLIDLKFAIKIGDTSAALEAIDGAINLLHKQLKEQDHDPQRPIQPNPS